MFRKITRWLVSFGILSVYTAFLITVDIQSMDIQVHAQSLPRLQTQIVRTVNTQSFTLNSIKQVVDEHRTCLESTENFSQCTKRLLLILPIIIHVS